MSIFGKRAASLGTAALLVGATLGAQQVSGAALPSTHRAAPSGSVSITDWQFPDGCGPGAASVANTEVCGATAGGLFGLDNNIHYFPVLATRIPTPSNGGAKIVGGNLVVTYTLKPNLKWSDGSSLTAQDFIFGTNVELSIGNSLGIDQIKSMKAVNSTTLQVTYKGKYAPYYSEGAPIDLPQAYFQKKYGSTDIATIGKKFLNDLYNSPSDVFDGAFKIKSWTNGQSVVLEPNPYWNALPGPSGHAPLAEIKFVNISGTEPGLATALQSANAGVDKAEDFQANDLPVLQKSKYHITNQPALTFEHLELNQAGPLKDQRLREALQYAINKPALYHALFPQVADPTPFMMKSVLPNASPWLNKSLSVSQYNPAKAKQLLQAAGYSTDYNGSGKHLELTFATTTAGVRQLDFQVLSRDWANVGIHVSAKFVSGDPSANGGLFSPYNLNGVLSQRRFDIALFAFSEPPDPQSSETSFLPNFIPTPAVHSASQQNYCGITAKDQANLLIRARTALDTAQRHALINQWQKLVSSRVYWIMLYERSNITADNGHIGNYKPNPTSAGNSWNAYQWYAK